MFQSMDTAMGLDSLEPGTILYHTIKISESHDKGIKSFSCKEVLKNFKWMFRTIRDTVFIEDL